MNDSTQADSTKTASTKTDRTRSADASTGPLEVTAMSVAYGAILAVQSISLSVRPGQVVALLGANGAGKSSTARAIMGLVKSTSEGISLSGRDLRGLSAVRRARAGIALVPEGRRVLTSMSVQHNLLVGAHRSRDRRAVRRDLQQSYDRFPILAQRRSTPAGALSGGEQQILAIARALMGRPSVVIMDEPTMGVAPIVTEQVVALVTEIAREGVGVLLAEQNAAAVLPICDSVVVLENGTVAYAGNVDETLQQSAIVDAFLGVAD